MVRVALVAGEPPAPAGIVALLQAGGADVVLQEGAQAAADPSIDLVLLDQDLLARDGEVLLDRVRGRYPAALVCLLASFARRLSEPPLKVSDIWDVLYLPAQTDEVDDLLSRTASFVERRAAAERPKQILVVDDEESIREACRELLSGRGYCVETAVDALEAVGKLYQRRFDLVVTDLQMPGMDGVALLGRIRAAHPQLPVVISTGHATVETAVAALRTGATDFIRKPFASADFLQVIERALRFGELSRTNLELEGQARGEKIRLRERQYELRVLATAIAEMSRAVHPAQVAECWLSAADQVVDFSCGGFLLVNPDPELVLLDRRDERCRPAELLARLAERAPGLIAGVSLEAVRVRRVVAAAGDEPKPRAAEEVAHVHVLGPATIPCAGVILLQARADGAAAPQESFLRSLTAPAAQVLEKLRALAGEARLREAAMVAGMHQGVILADIEGRILVMNAAARELLALPPGGEARNLSRLSAERDVPMAAAVAELLSGGGETLSREFPLRQPAERILALDLSVIRGETRAAIAVVGLLRDITELREVERMKSEFVTIVSHELRTPLTTIKNCNSLLLGGSTGAITPPQERFLRMAQVSIDRITRLVNDLLDVAKIEAGRLPLVLSQVDLTELILEVAHELELLLLESGARLAFFGLDAPLPVRADRERLKQVFFNLMHNAVKFSPPGGLVEVRVALAGRSDYEPAIRERLARAGEELVEVRVVDQGVGIPAEDLELIFDRFHQVEKSLRREHGGIGLGLPISRGIVRSHGGEIWAEHGQSGGSVFRVIMPRACQTAGDGETGDGEAGC